MRRIVIESILVAIVILRIVWVTVPSPYDNILSGLAMLSALALWMFAYDRIETRRNK